ncbi:MAG: sialate O-acetylesterase, partial [Aeoliella sp.]
AWEVCSPGTAQSFSGVGYFFGRRLQQTLGVPIGLIDNAWGGSSCETWVPREKLENKPLYAQMLQQWDKQAAEADEPALRAEYAKVHQGWKEKMQAAVAASNPIPNWPGPRHALLTQHRPGNLYNSRVAPLMPFAIRGAIWYQGESNASRAAQYRDLFPLMIETWRDAWGQGDFPFYWVQLADYMQEKEQPGQSNWAELREAQTMALDRLPNSGEAVIIDLGEGNDIHPRNKRSVADRLARHALANQYDVPVACASPRFESLQVTDGKAIVTLRDCGRGLMSFDTKEIHGFSIAGADDKWVEANATIIGKNQVEVSNDQVAEPVAVRYAWADNPVCNLYSQIGLPVTPFRTDD